MAPADVLTALAAVAFAGVPPTTTKQPTTTTATTLTQTTSTRTTDVLVRTFVSTVTTTADRTTLGASSLVATPTTFTSSSTPTWQSAPCYPGPCSPYMAVSFGPFADDDNSRFVATWGAAAFAGAFGLLALAHLVQGACYRWKPAAAAVVGGLATLAGYTLQATVAQQSMDIQPYLLAASFVLLQIAPLCITLYAYLVLTKLAHTRFLPAHDSLPPSGKPVWPSNGRWLSHWSVVAILACASAAQAVAVAFLVYCGLTTLSVDHALLVAADLVWTAGLAGQEVVVLVLLAAVTQAFATLPPARPGGQQERAASGAVPTLSLPPRRRVQLIWLLGTTYGVLAMVTMRLVYRIVVAVRASEGHPLPSEERVQVYALVLEAAPTCLALALLSVCHAGWALPVNEPSHLRPESEPGNGGPSRRTTDRDEEAVVVAGDECEEVSVPQPRGVHFNPPAALTPAQILVQQRAIIQRQRQQQRQQWQRQWQMHRQRAPESDIQSPVVEALARSSLSASLSVSLPRESFAMDRPDVINAEGNAESVDNSTHQRTRLGRLSMDNFILFRFLNAPSRSASSGRPSRGMTTSTRSRQSGWSGRSGRSRRTPHSHSTPSQGGDSAADDPFAGFDYTFEGERHDNNHGDNDADSRRTCDSPDEKRGAPAWP
ncbi:hypothetical protein SEUCBS139899_009500 [Sporothrix eucalyptigena]